MSQHGPYRLSKFDEWLRSFDPYTHAMTVIQEEHRLIHDGMMFHISGKQTGLSNGASADFMFRTVAGNYPHFHRAFVSTSRGDIDIQTYEGITVSADGTPITIHNTNRNSSNTNEMTAFGSPTVTDLGTNLHTLWVPPTGSGVGSQIGILNVGFGEEWVLAPSTDYLMRITNNSGGSLDFSYDMLFYEATYGD